MRFALTTALLLCTLPVLASAAPPAAQPASSPVTYEVWGYRWDGHQYVKDPTRCLATPDPKQAADYAAQVNSFPGWVATTNLPDAYRKAAAGPQPAHPADIDFGPIHIRGNADGSQMVYMPYMSVRVPASMAGKHWTFSSNGGGSDVGTSTDTSVQDSVALQDMLNQQQQNQNVQDMINTQNMIDTQNMVNNMQDMVNTQNAVNEQNMINSMNQ
jgi:hypothetical protein